MGDHTSPNSVSDFLDYVSKVYAIATKYNTEVKNSSDVSYANRITMEYLRHWKYGDWTWKKLLGDYDTAFIAYADSNGAPTHLEDYQDPWPERIKTDHVFAAMNGAWLLPSFPPAGSSGGIPNEGDVAGWGGDWIGFYADWRNNYDTYPDDQGEAYAQTFLGKTNDGLHLHFNLRPCIEDADGWNIAKLLRDDPTLPLDQACQKYFHPTTSTGDGYQSRFQSFYTNRFGGIATQLVDIATDILINPENDKVWNARQAIIILALKLKQLINPFTSPMPNVSDLRMFAKGYDDALQSLIVLEKAKP